MDYIFEQTIRSGEYVMNHIIHNILKIGKLLCK